MSNRENDKIADDEMDKNVPDAKPNWKVKCQICDAKPTVDDTRLCGPCCFGKADMIDWWE